MVLTNPSTSDLVPLLLYEVRGLRFVPTLYSHGVVDWGVMAQAITGNEGHACSFASLDLAI